MLKLQGESSNSLSNRPLTATDFLTWAALERKIYRGPKSYPYAYAHNEKGAVRMLLVNESEGEEESCIPYFTLYYCVQKKGEEERACFPRVVEREGVEVLAAPYEVMAETGTYEIVFAAFSCALGSGDIIRTHFCVYEEGDDEKGMLRSVAIDLFRDI